MNLNKLFALVVLFSLFLSVVPVAAEQTGAGSAALKENYLKARADYLNAKKAYMGAQREWKVTKARFRAREPQAFNRGQNFLEKGTLHLMQYLNVLSKKIEESRALNDIQKTALKNELAGYTTTLEADVVKIRNATTVEELRAAANATRADWDSIRPQAKRIIGELLLAKAEMIVARAENSSARIDSAIANLKAKGRNTTSLESFRSDFKAKAAFGRGRLLQMRTKLNEAKTAGDASGALISIDQFLRGANHAMMELHFELGRIIREIRFSETGQGGQVPPNVTLLARTPIAPDQAESEAEAEQAAGGV